MTSDNKLRARPHGSLRKGSGIRTIAATTLVLAILWVGLCGTVMVQNPPSTSTATLLYLAATTLPVAILGVCLSMLNAAWALQKDTERLHTTVEALRQAFLEEKATSSQVASEASLIQKMSEIAQEQRKIHSLINGLENSSSPPNEQPSISSHKAASNKEGTNQTVLELGTPIEVLDTPLSNSDFIRALNFPETPEDRVGFTIMNRALKDHLTSQMIRAAQDMLTLLSQDGIYMDDLRPDMARPDVWRQFANGERGKSIAALGGIHDRSSLALSNGRIKQDPVFRDTTHHFLRVFDKCFAKFEAKASDAEISAFSETRTARAFMLLGRVAGTFS